mmetsp:Transcript_15028/g.50425  ORF Transcript_15028/g.50425 Transcript_15028/m.50425 type:complete len:323 (+) Transcript_15028:50-1018(+)
MTRQATASAHSRMASCNCTLRTTVVSASGRPVRGSARPETSLEANHRWMACLSYDWPLSTTIAGSCISSCVIGQRNASGHSAARILSCLSSASASHHAQAAPSKPAAILRRSSTRCAVGRYAEMASANFRATPPRRESAVVCSSNNSSKSAASEARAAATATGRRNMGGRPAAHSKTQRSSRRAHSRSRSEFTPRPRARRQRWSKSVAPERSVASVARVVAASSSAWSHSASERSNSCSAVSPAAAAAPSRRSRPRTTASRPWGLSFSKAVRSQTCLRTDARQRASTSLQSAVPRSIKCGAFANKPPWTRAPRATLWPFFVE